MVLANPIYTAFCTHANCVTSLCNAYPTLLPLHCFCPAGIK